MNFKLGRCRIASCFRLTIVCAFYLATVACEKRRQADESATKNIVLPKVFSNFRNEVRLANDEKVFKGKPSDPKFASCFITAGNDGFAVYYFRDANEGLDQVFGVYSSGMSFGIYPFAGMRRAGLGNRLETPRQKCVDFERNCYNYIEYSPETFEMTAFGDMNSVGNSECRNLEMVPAASIEKYRNVFSEIESAVPVEKNQIPKACFDLITGKAAMMLTLASEMATPIKEGFLNFRQLKRADGSTVYAFDARYTNYVSDKEGKVAGFGAVVKEVPEGKCAVLGGSNGFQFLSGILAY